ncbi:hypothetical protein BGX34_011646 [Mortierella sp. NVP85]|nr:hypothetical protein BGX34_011646 [Mortierella sp. NVP85]
MESETSILPPRTRLSELKSSADIPTEEPNHSIKTWVNMASLLVKQGNTAEFSDDESAYISYVRACLIITKVIPQQALYHSMMNDIVCIDLRQKILGVISRIVYLERKLLKRFEQENQERLTMLANEASPPTALTITTKSILSSPPPGKSIKEREKEKENDDLLFLQKSVYRRRYSTKEEGTDESGDEIEECTEMKFDVPASFNLASSNVDSSDKAEPAPTLRKKSSNDDERASLTPECQSNLTTPSTLSPTQCDSAHVRRCSSSDTIRKSVQFPVSYQPAVAPAVPPRSQKRASTVPMARTSSSNSNISAGSDVPMATSAQDNCLNSDKTRLAARRTTTCESNMFNHNSSSASVTPSEVVDYSTMPKIAQAYMLRKSISNRSDSQPTPLSVETLPNTTDGSSSSASLSASISGSMKAGLLRKIRSRPKMKDQVFEIVASPSLTPAHTSPSSTSPALVHLQHQQKLVV